MSLYARFILPWVVDCVCGLRPAWRQREKIIPLAAGRVLEVGIGSGLNLPLYDAAKVQQLWGLDPSEEMWALARPRNTALHFNVAFLQASAEAIPLDEGSVDTVVVTYTLCTIPNVLAALQEMRRVLRPGGQLLFCEHGAAPDEAVRRWQDRLTPLWKRLGGGCHLNRPIASLLEAGGFRIATLETGYIPGWKPACFNYWGRAWR
jgi:ubiquinone/menaquinone biosynthesis C-methylase UbiE